MTSAPLRSWLNAGLAFANAKAVVGECGPETEIDDDIRAAIAAVPYDRLCATALGLLRWCTTPRWTTNPSCWLRSEEFPAFDACASRRRIRGTS